ncbi:pre-rRNA processing protein-like protein Utp22 [Plenodomus tracheiphilus IPT5]|uniref:U3 small nucleolar RNA-associated protein 22 n=1 Tax=Plenodomus tracheiphilus IPT5 TaxID=1408161 RepID=A0A6A7B161_9PLEO|nr:pre-rRNA processing protein-like protein Utp22 [Plenodomus tracheiphilus IPT5]
MAPPAVKRRKLQHGDSEDTDSEVSFAASSDHNGIALEGRAAEDASDASDASVNGLEDMDDDDDDMSDDAEQGVKPGIARHDGTKQPPATKATSARAQKPSKRPASSLQDGVYTSESFKSNMFKFQLDHLLDQVKLKYAKKEAPAESAMRTLKAIIEHIPNRDALSIVAAEKALGSAGITVPFPSPRPPKDALYKLTYERPASVNATGSYPLKTATRTEDDITIDLVVTMPKGLFQDKDYLNHRYFYKRAYYLACLAAGIKDSKYHKFALSYDCLNGNQLQPILVVRPSGNGDEDDFTSSKCRINILVALPEHTFAQNKLLPSSNCIRPKGTDEETLIKTLNPTPFYNSTLQSDANVTAYLKLLHATASKADAFRDACILGRVWLKQRGFGGHFCKGGFGNFEWAAIMALLLQPNATTGAQSVSSAYSSYQLFKATLQFLGRGDLIKKPFIFRALNITIPKNDIGPVVFDGPRGQNILFKMTPWSYLRLRSEAKATIDMLSDTVFDQFDAAFILKTELLKFRYDATVEIPYSALDLASAGEEYDQRLSEISRKLYTSLGRAMSDRVTAMTITIPEEDSWPLTSRRPKGDERKSMLINFATDPANANRTVDHGPAAELKQEAASFRKFWGEKSELRRFKDGSILESIVWITKDGSAPVIEQITSYILKKHIGARVAEQAKFFIDSFSHLVAAGRIQGASGVAPFLTIMNAFSAMEKDIRDLEDLPLRLRHIRAADSQLRYSSIEPPTAGHAPASVVLQFEGSGRWPDDLCAIQRTKIAFLLRLSELLTTLGSGYTSRVGLENPSQPAQNQAFLDVTTSSGYTFRIRIYHDREPTLFDRQIKDKTLDAPSRESAAASLALYKREFVTSPLHSQVLQTLCTRFPALSPAIRLTKRWFASHLITPYFSPELIELLVVRTFLQPHPWSIPATATTGFLRTLAWISRWDWRHVPLVVDFSSTFSANPADLEDTSSKGMKAEDLERMQTRFEAWRRIDPAMNRVVLFAATNLDEEGTTWTDKAKPEKVVAARLTALAKAATQAVRADEDCLIARANGKATASAQATLDPESLFKTSVSDYDILISINPKYSNPKSRKRTSSIQFKNLDLQRSTSAGASVLLPQLFAQELLDVYGDAVLWFWDSETLDQIVGLWNPVVTGQRSWKIKPGWNSEPMRRKKDGEVAVEIKANRAAIVNEVKRLGGELVKSIDVKE